jgi:SPP1 gp7 family putative phage head morphogenesis protein
MMKNPASFAATLADSLGNTSLVSRIEHQREVTKRFAASTLTLDAQSRRQRQREAEHFAKILNVYHGYAAKLRRIARHVSDIIRAYPPGDPAGVEAINRYLRDYASILRPWARATGQLMVAEVSRRDYTAWVRHARLINRELDKELLWGGTLTGDEMRRIVDEQVELITSIPLEAAQRVQDLSQAYWVAGRRYGYLREEVLESREDIARKLLIEGINATTQSVYNRASLIARTETARTSSAVTQSRAQYIGATHFTWKTALDADVRPLHRKLEGRIFAYDDPPVIGDNGETGLPGTIYNCRCWQSPHIPPPEEIGR